MIYCSYSMMDADGRRISDFIVSERTSYAAMLEESVLSCSTVLLSRSIYSEYRFSTNYYHEDYALSLIHISLPEHMDIAAQILHRAAFVPRKISPAPERLCQAFRIEL